MPEFLLYRSSAVHPEGDQSNLAILREALRNNPRRGVTGFLHREQGAFFQYLEGSADALSETFDRIARDRRHFGLRKLDGGATDAPRFPDFSMAFVSRTPLISLARFAFGDAHHSLSEVSPAHVTAFLVTSSHHQRLRREIA